MGPDINNLKEAVNLDVLDAVLSGMRYPGGRLHPRLRGEGLVYVVHAMNRPLFGKGMLFFYALTSPDKLPRAEAIITEELLHIKANRISKEELDTAKAQVIFAYQDALSAPRDKAITAA